MDKPRGKSDRPTVVLGRAMREARGSMTQQALADVLNEALDTPETTRRFSRRNREAITQSTISRWESGANPPNLGDIFMVEAACGRPLGSVLVRAGFIDDIASVPLAIAGDPDLDEEGRSFVSTAYEAARDQALRRRAARSAASRGRRGTA